MRILKPEVVELSPAQAEQDGELVDGDLYLAKDGELRLLPPKDESDDTIKLRIERDAASALYRARRRIGQHESRRPKLAEVAAALIWALADDADIVSIVSAWRSRKPADDDAQS